MTVKIYPDMTPRNAPLGATDWFESSVDNGLGAYITRRQSGLNIAQGIAALLNIPSTPVTVTANSVARFTGTSGDIISDSLAILDDLGNLSVNTLTGFKTTNQLILGITHTTTLSATAPASSFVATIPDGGGSCNFILSAPGTVSVPIIRGGTGQITKTLGFDALSPLSAKGDLLGYTGSTNQSLPVGADGTVLTANASSATGWLWLENPSGDVVGPSSSINTGIARYSGTTGKLLTNGSGTIDSSGNLSTNTLAATAPNSQLLLGAAAHYVTINALSMATPFVATIPDAGGTCNFILSQAGTTTTLPTAVQDNITRLGTIASISTPLGVPFGGTGAASQTANSILIGNGSAAFLNIGALTNGQVVIGSTGTLPVRSTLTAGTGINIANSAGSITISATGAATVYPPNYFTGCLLTFNSTTSVTVAAGNMVDSTNTYNLDFTQANILTNQNGVNGLDVGSAANNTTYYVYIIGNSAGGVTNAPIASTSPTSPSFANAGAYNIYTKTPYRFQTNGSAQVIGFIHTANIMQVNLVTTTKTLTQADANTFQYCSNASAQTITVPPVSSVPWIVGDTIKFTWLGAGQPSIVNGGGVSILSAFLNGKIGVSDTSAYLQYLGADVWLLEGNLTA